MYRWEITQQLASARAFAVLRQRDAETATELGEAVIEAGLPAEVSLTTPGGLRAIAELTSKKDGRLVGAGTVLDAASAQAAIAAGARFIVSPAIDAEVLAAGHRYGVPVLPGAQTPTEIYRALELGADMVKLFPADSMAPSFISAVRAALPQAPLVPTGGVSADNARAWIEAGAVAVAVGGWLSAGGTDGVRGRVRELIRALAMRPA